MLIHEPEPFWHPGFQRELREGLFEIQSLPSLNSLSDQLHPEDQALLWVVLDSQPGEQMRHLTAIKNRHPDLAIVVLTAEPLSTLKWILYELQMLAVLDLQIPLVEGLKICRRYWKSASK
ncbi:MAG: hypothetical protein R3C11_19690 [Planctomycetaceae bacterium]